MNSDTNENQSIDGFFYVSDNLIGMFVAFVFVVKLDPYVIATHSTGQRWKQNGTSPICHHGFFNIIDVAEEGGFSIIQKHRAKTNIKINS